MAKSKGVRKRNLGIILLAGLLVQFVFPHIMLGFLSWIGTAVILAVAIYLLL